MCKEKNLSFCKGVCRALSRLDFYESSSSEVGMLLDDKVKLLKTLLADSAHNYLLMPLAPTENAPKKYQPLIEHPNFNLARQYLRKELVDRLYGQSLRREWKFPEFEEYLYWLQALISHGESSKQLLCAEKNFLTALKDGFYPEIIRDAFLVLAMFSDEIEDKSLAKAVFASQKNWLLQQTRRMFHPSAACGF